MAGSPEAPSEARSAGVVASLLLAGTLMSHCSVTLKSGGEQERGLRIENASPPHLVCSVPSQRWREIRIRQ